MYVLSFVFIALQVPYAVIWTDVAAVLMGAFLPFFIKGDFDPGIISFPHLAERFELLTIITFGESVVGMTGYFDIEHFSVLPILIFLLIITLFGSYVLQIHELMNHHQVTRALPLMFSHYFIVIAVNLITIGIHMLHADNRISLFVPVLLLVGEFVFYAGIFSNRIYNFPEAELSHGDLKQIALLQLPGIVIVIIGHTSAYGIICGMLWISCTGFIELRKKRNALRN